MPTSNIACFLMAIWIVGTALFANPVRAACEDADFLLQAPQQRLQQINHQRTRLQKLISGQLSPAFDLNNNLPLPLDRRVQVFSAELALSDLEQNAAELPAALEDCPEEEQRWNSLQHQIRSQKEALHQQQMRLYDLPRPTRQALVRVLGHWQGLYHLQQNLEQWATEDATPPTTALSKGIHDWVQEWRISTNIWLAQLHFQQDASITSNNIAELILQVPNPGQAADWYNYAAAHNDASSPDVLAWLEQMEEAQSALLRESSKWRNQRIWDLGWGKFFADLQRPQRFWHQLVNEAREAPINLIDAITRPFIRDYRRALREGSRGELLSSWFLQILALSVVLSALMQLAKALPRQLSQLQQNLMNTLQHRSVIRFNSAFMWFIKPNAPWLVVLVGSNLLAHSIPADWQILQWVGPIGTLYSVFRAARVILEWLISRTFTRSGQFVPTQTAEQQAADAHRVSWVVVLCFLSWVLVKGTGGGYLMFFVTLFNFALCWCGLLWLMLRYREGVARFLLFVVGKGRGRNLDSADAQRWWMILFWPLLFLLAHGLDVVINLHQKLMVFDTYRSLSIKLMRLRLAAEARDDEASPSDDADTVPDQNYREWMLQDEGKPALNIHALENLMAPIQRWCRDNSDDNVLLIVGDQGSGKSSLLNALQEAWKDTPVSLLRIPPKTTDNKLLLTLLGQHLGVENLQSVADLVKRSDALDPQVVIIENSQNLFLSAVGYLDAYRLFNQCLNASLPRIYWVVVMHSQSWIYLSCVFNRELRFTHIYRMPRWSPADIRSLILSRHQHSGRKLNYDELLLSASAGSESSSIRAANSRVFNILWEQSAGNPQVAIQLWLAAARPRQREVDIGVPAKPGTALLKELQDDLCFIYASIMTHKTLSSDEIMLVTHYAEPIVRHALKQGLHLGLLRRDETKRYGIESSWQGTLTSYLISKNMLWNL